jgi:hypothetical protein
MRKTLVAGKLWVKSPALLKPDSLILFLFPREQSEWNIPVPRNSPRGTCPAGRATAGSGRFKILFLSRERPQAARVCCFSSTRAKIIFRHWKPVGFSLVLRTRGKDQRRSAQSAVKALILFSLIYQEAISRKNNRRSRRSPQIKNKLYRCGRNSPLKPDARIQGS